MTTTAIMANFINYIISRYDDDFEIQRILQNEKYEYRYKVITRCEDYNLVILCTHDNSLCVQWEDDIYYYRDDEWKCLATFY